MYRYNPLRMHRFWVRLRNSMISAGLRPTPQELAKIAPISKRMARLWLRMPRADMAAWRLAPVAFRLRVRMVWLATGKSVPQVTEVMDATDRAIVELLGRMTSEQKYRLLALAQEMFREE